MEEETHPRLPTNNSTTKNNATPSVPQSNQVHGTSQQNQCAQYSAGQDILASTMELPKGNQTPATGTDGYTPHRDEGTQMPSQEIHMITINQSTQIPSQQWELPRIASSNEAKLPHSQRRFCRTPPQGQGHTGQPILVHPHNPLHWRQISTLQLNRVQK